MSKKKSVSPIEKNVMVQIQTGQAKMRPRLYYSILTLAGVVSILLFSFVNTYFMSVVTLWLRVQAAQGPAYGARRNLASLIEVFPGWALLLGVVSLAGAIYRIRKVGSLYKMKLVHLISLVVAVSLALGLIFSYSALPNTFNRHGSACMGCNNHKMK